MATIAIDARILRSSTGRYVEKLLDNLQGLETPHKFVVILAEGDLGYWKPKALNFRVVSTKAKSYTFAKQIEFLFLLYSLKCDLVHFTMPQQPVLYFGATVTTIHDLTMLRFANIRESAWLYKIKQKVFTAVLFWAAFKSKVIICPTHFVKSDIQQTVAVGLPSIKVTYEAAERILATPVAFSDLLGRSILLYVGNAFPYKNISMLAQAFQKVKGRLGDDVVLVLAGKHDYFYRQLLEKYPIERWAEHGVYIPGYVSEAQLRWLYENSKVYCFPSLSEGFGLPGLEAMVCGVPVISSNATCLPEVYGNAAVYFDPRNPADLASTIEGLWNDSAQAKKLATRGLDRAAGFSWSRMAVQTYEVYSGIVASPTNCI